MNDQVSQEAIVADKVPKVYDFLNYREYLYCFYEYRKRRQKGFSFTVFSRKAGFKTPNLLIMIVNNKRNLTDPNIPGLSQACGHSAEEANYFQLLVKWNQETDSHLKQDYERKLSRLLPRKNIRELEQNHFNIIRKWYSLALLELLNLKDFQYRTSWIQSRLSFSLTEREIFEVFRDLLKLGLVTRKDNSIEKAFDTTLFKTKTPSEIIRSYHEHNMQLAIKRLKEVPMDARQYVTATFAIEEKQVQFINQMVSDFHQTLLDYVQGLPKGDHVYQCNVQFFPVTQKEKTD